MEVAIGIQHSPRELRVETNASAQEVREMVEGAFADGQRLLWLTDTKGKQIAIPTDKLAYVEVGADREHIHVGFTIAAEE